MSLIPKPVSGSIDRAAASGLSLREFIQRALLRACHTPGALLATVGKVNADICGPC